MMRILKAFLISMALLPGLAAGQARIPGPGGAVASGGGLLSTGIIDAPRASDWTKAGVVGGIPTRNTICASLGAAGQSPTYVQSVTGAAISAAIASCPTGQVIYENPGTYSITDQAVIMKSGVTLRGAGADQTLMIFNLGSYYYTWSCNGGYANICFNGGAEYYGSADVQPGQSNAASWTGGYAQGSTSITLTNVGTNGIVNGQFLFLDQSNVTAPGPNFFVCDQNSTSPFCSLLAGSPGRNIGGIDYNQIQMVQVVSGCSSVCAGAGPFTLTITPGLYSPNWASAYSPGAWWAGSYVHDAGVENMSIDASNDTTAGVSNVQFSNAYNLWVTGCRLIRKSSRAQVRLVPCAHCTVADNYFFGSLATSQSYGVEGFIDSDPLIVNNIFQQVTSPHIQSGEMGAVFAYNYSVNNVYTPPSTWMIPQGGAHDAAVEYDLSEGNIGQGWGADVFHGTSGLFTLYRNRYFGWGTNGNPATAATQNTVAIEYLSFNRYTNTVGNVLGLEGYSAHYQDPSGKPSTVTSGTADIYNLGAGNSTGPVTVSSDILVQNSMLIWGNYDNVTAAVRWCGNSADTGWVAVCGSASEVPTGSAPYVNAVPTKGDTGIGQSVMPPSFAFVSQPSFLSGYAWPLIGPDVTGGDLGICSGGTYAFSAATQPGQCTGGTKIPSGGGHAYAGPAIKCALETMGIPPDGSGTVASFNAAACY
jgi:hypothetical protein